MNEGSVRPGMRWHSHWRWRVEVIEVTFMNVIRQALKDIYIQTRTHGQRGTNAQTHTPSQTHAHMQGAWPHRCELTQIFLCLTPSNLFQRREEYSIRVDFVSHQAPVGKK